MTDQLRYIYSNHTGLFRQVDEQIDDLAKLQDYEVLVNALPKKSCGKCYGRGYIGRDIIRNEKVMCRKCFRKITDFSHARERVKAQLEKVQTEIAANEQPTPVKD